LFKKNESRKSRDRVPLIVNPQKFFKKVLVLFKKNTISSSVAEPHHFYAAPAPAPGKNFDAAPAAPAPTLLYSKAKLFK
jgi:hypothetical protein